MVAGLGGAMDDLIAQRRRVAVHGQRHHRAVHAQVEMAHQAAHRGADVRRVLHQQADQAQIVQRIALPDQQAEMCAAGGGHAMTQQPPAGREGDDAVVVIEQRQIDARISKHLHRVRAQAAQHLGNRAQGADTGGRCRGRATRRHAPVVSVCRIDLSGVKA